jgi:hypothetical protein
VPLRWVQRAFIAGAFVATAALSISLVRSRPGATPPPLPPAAVDPLYATSVQPVFDRRCVVCHSCFDSPCQLNLQSFDGADRGGSKAVVYDAARLLPIHPTRMFQDAQTAAEWQQRFGFFPVLARGQGHEVAPEASILGRLVEQRRRAADPVAVDIDAPKTCPVDLPALDAELRSQPSRGMPLGFPPLAEGEARAVEDWLRRGAGRPESPRESDATLAEIARWESFLNTPDARSRIVARYLFEHLYFGHLSLESAPGEWFHLVRSRTKAPAPADVIATVRPYDDPRTKDFQYRLVRLNATVVEKSHIPYALGDAKLARLRHLFIDADWGPRAVELPSYDAKVAANPFVAFAAIPARARYQFLLDDAYYHVRNFIHGPVCKGQIALNVIDEHFLIFFLSPDADPAVTHPDLLPGLAPELAVPAQGGDGIEAVYARFKLLELGYLRDRAAYLARAGAPGRAIADVWDGDGTNRDAVLTVYRHFDSAFVLRGAAGGVPKTAWVLDYPIFERLYYDLVAGFDVFGNLVHQVSTRRYMNLLRMEAEAGFLSFLPSSERAVLRDAWYRPPGVAKVVDLLDPVYASPETRVPFDDPAHAKEELITRLVTRDLPPAVVGPREPVQWTDVAIDGGDPAARFERAARTIAARAADFVRLFPDSTLLRIHDPGKDDAVFTVIRNKAHLNIDFMFLENQERVPAEDTLHVVPGFATSRPNLFLTVSAADVERFVADVASLHGDGGAWSRFLDRYGARRRDAALWTASDFFNARFLQIDPRGAGILDLSRYIND